MFLNRISSEDEAKAFEMWALGHSRDQTARKLMMGEGTVSNLWASIPACFQPLRDLAKALRKLNLLPQDALKGTDVLELLAEHGVSPEQLRLFLQAVVKASTGLGYEPQTVVQALIKIVDFENRAGASYPIALKKFEELAREIPARMKEKTQILRDIRQNKKKRKEALEKAKVTEKEISQVNEWKSNLQYYEIDLFNVEQLLDYLNNMSETGQNPRSFVSFSKKVGSIERYLSDLDEQKQMKTATLDFADRQIKSKTTELNQLKADHQAFMARANLERESIRQATAAENIKLQKVKADVDAANSQLSDLKSAIQQAEHRQQKVTKATERTLGIKNFAIEHQGAIAALEIKRVLLEDEVNAQSSKIAFATVITDFLTKEPDILFDLFYVEVQRIKEVRENPNSPLKPLLPDLTEAIRFKALGAINGNSRFPILNSVLNENQRLRTENAHLNQKVYSLEMEKSRKPSLKPLPTFDQETQR